MTLTAHRTDAPTPALAAMRILLVDDEEAALVVMKSLLTSAGYRFVETCDDPRAAAARFRELRPDLLVLDYRMPGRDGLAVLDELAPELPDAFPVLMVTGDERPGLREAALAGGAKDFLTKPVNATEARLRIRNLLEARRLQLELMRQNERLEAAVRRRTQELEHSQLEMLVRLARAAEYRDDDTGEHTWRVAHVSGMIAQEMGMRRDRVELLLRAARLHDVGKITIPDGILMKPGKLTPEEYAVVKGHAAAGAQLLSGSRSPLIRLAEQIALTHHERWDGKGYPQGLKGEEIPLEARILAVADAYDALTHDRSHRKAVSQVEAVKEIVRHAGEQFDPAVVIAFERAFAKGLLVVPRDDA
ncbi:MAG: response regulator [Deinococcales bacterium]|nr:response regulator [Deinococcales bacterium]